MKTVMKKVATKAVLKMASEDSDEEGCNEATKTAMQMASEDSDEEGCNEDSNADGQ